MPVVMKSAVNLLFILSAFSRLCVYQYNYIQLVGYYTIKNVKSKANFFSDTRFFMLTFYPQDRFRDSDGDTK